MFRLFLKSMFSFWASEQKENKRCLGGQRRIVWLCVIYPLLLSVQCVSTWQSSSSSSPCEGLCSSHSRTPSHIKAVPKHCTCQPLSSAPYAAKHECKNPNAPRPGFFFLTPPASVLITLVFKGCGAPAARCNLWKAWCSKTNVERVEWAEGKYGERSERKGVVVCTDTSLRRPTAEGSSFGLEPHAIPPLSRSPSLPLTMHIKCMTRSEEEF